MRQLIPQALGFHRSGRVSAQKQWNGEFPNDDETRRWPLRGGDAMALQLLDHLRKTIDVDMLVAHDCREHVSGIDRAIGPVCS